MSADPFVQQALQLHQAGRLAEAETLYRQALAQDGRHYHALNFLGLLYFQMGRAGEAAAMMEGALQVKPGAPETLANYGLALASLGRDEEGLTALRQAVAAMPGNSAIHGNIGGLLHKLGRSQEALGAYEQALARNPADVGALINRGVTLQALRRDEDAVLSFSQALRHAPDHPAALNGRGLSLMTLQRHDAALPDFNRLLQLQPDHPGALVNRAGVLWALGRVDEALADYDRALGMNRDQIEALTSRASLNWGHRQVLEAALDDLARLARLAPEQPGVAGDLLHLKMQAADWRGFAAAAASLEAGIRAGKPLAEPLVFQGVSDSPADLLACARLQVARKFPPRAALHAPSQGPEKKTKIRIGYVSSGLGSHAAGFLNTGLFEGHDRARFEIFAFDNSRAEMTPLRTRLEAAFDHRIDIAGLSDAAAAARIAAEEIDILVSLDGHEGGGRLGIFAHRPAPVQAHYPGFPGTLGAPYMDYILADKVVIPSGEEKFFEEQVVRLPGSYQMNDGGKPMPQAAPPREALALPEFGFVFCAFNQNYRITPDLFALWLRLLKAVEGSVLWLLEPHPLFARHVREAASSAGIDPARLVFAPQLPEDEHLTRLACADLFLDTAPCGAQLFASHALWAGVPLLTCRGGSFASRSGASLLTAIGLPELITDTLDTYEAKALELANDPARLSALRAKLRMNRTATPLFDTAYNVRAVERAYDTMQARRLRGEAPESFTVK